MRTLLNSIFCFNLTNLFSVHNGNDIDEIIRIPDVMFNSARLRRRHFYDEILNTLLRQPMQQVDSAVTYGVRYETKNHCLK